MGNVIVSFCNFFKSKSHIVKPGSLLEIGFICNTKSGHVLLTIFNESNQKIILLKCCFLKNCTLGQFLQIGLRIDYLLHDGAALRK
jgi:hypothetical protein